MTVFRWTLAAALGLLAGCSSNPQGGPGPAAPEYSVLQEVGELLRTAEATAGRPPAKLADLDRHKSMFPRGYDAVKSGAVVVLWGGAMKGEGETGQSEAVVAYDKDVPANGGYVLMSAGTVQKMSAAEFSAAPKAGKR